MENDAENLLYNPGMVTTVSHGVIRKDDHVCEDNSYFLSLHVLNEKNTSKQNKIGNIMPDLAFS